MRSRSFILSWTTNYEPTTPFPGDPEIEVDDGQGKERGSPRGGSSTMSAGTEISKEVARPEVEGTVCGISWSKREESPDAKETVDGPIVMPKFDGLSMKKIFLQS